MENRFILYRAKPFEGPSSAGLDFTLSQPQAHLRAQGQSTAPQENPQVYQSFKIVKHVDFLSLTASQKSTGSLDFLIKKAACWPSWKITGRDWQNGS